MSLTRRSFLVKTVMASSALACQPLIAHADSKVNITISHGIPNFPLLLDGLKHRFVEKHPDIRLEFVAGGNNWGPALQATLRDAVVSNLPQAIWQNLTFANILASRDIIAPLNGFFGNAATLEAMGISERIIGSTTIDDHVFGMPYGTGIPVVFCNMDLLRKAGYKKDTPPKDWDDIIDVSAKIASLGSGIHGGFIEYESTNCWIFQNLLASFGGKMMDGDKIAFDGHEGLQSFKILSRFGAINNVPMSVGQARQAFEAGVTGFQIGTVSRTAAFSKAANGKFELKVAQFPVPAANGELAGGSHGLFMSTKSPEKQKAVWELMKFTLSPEGQLILAQSSGYIPVVLTTQNNPRFREEYLKIHPLLTDVVDCLAITRDQYSFPSGNTEQIFDMMIELCRQVVYHVKAPADALAEMAKKTRELLKA